MTLYERTSKVKTGNIVSLKGQKWGTTKATVTSNITLKKNKKIVTLGLPDGQQDLDLQGEDHCGDDDCGDGSGRDVGKVGREKSAGRKYDLKKITF